MSQGDRCTRPGCDGTIDCGYCDTCGLAEVAQAAPASAAPAGNACRQPGCGGTVDGGYCDTCGMAAASQPAPAASQSAPVTNAPMTSAPVTSAPVTGACPQPGCTGTIDGGYCDTCGLAAGAPAAEPVTTGSAVSSRLSGRASRRTTTTARSTSRRGGGLGAGLVDIPVVPVVDPAAAVLDNPQVAENKRFCRKCDQPVGRGKDGKPGRLHGFCPRDGTPFNFEPSLTKGTLVGGQYLVRGCLAHGGLGWIYLATDRNVNDRWVVLKGLLDIDDPAARAAAEAERRFLAEVNHPNIVMIHNFVEHPGDDGKPIGYIVMEYVGGSSLRKLVEDRGQAVGQRLAPLPLPQVIAYGLEILPALGYLHSQGLAYCDLKPDNAIQYERRLKLIDMGAVVPYENSGGFDWYGTPGYQAPNFESEGPSPAADIYTVGRTLAVLALGISPLRSGVPVPLPDPSNNSLMAKHESFYRVLLRATDPDSLRRFASAEEMADQLGGVLREVLAVENGKPYPGLSTLFGPPRSVFGIGLLGEPAAPGRPHPRAVAHALPVPLVDTTDSAAGLLATVSSAGPEEILRLARDATTPSTELRFRAVRAYLELGDVAAAQEALQRLRTDLPGDWRTDWFAGVAALVAGDPSAAAAAFDVVLATLPGESAPKLALAAAAECAADDAVAGRYYLQVNRPNPDIADAAFGRARVALRAGRPAEALTALDTVAPTSSQYVTAQTVAVRIMIGSGGLDEGRLRAAADRVERLSLDKATAHEVRASVFSAALPLVVSSAGGRPPLLGCTWSQRSVRAALESELRSGARLAPDEATRVELIDRANAVRPVSWV
ncbi:serine/threonine-protein kinase [Labedaea rhizosphaerae]|uniref:non-specific serine/threonine protein kinase n=1 Tax=Labedaea rhizosphaerae TaxID=598644 RepID=A0A4R6S1S3_LABRH|nr:serine/threonine-protein kinase [Labedaea rhizosphaerae]TDP92937.1 serine/threonine-protein kinase PknG [Labedaea rhizosphaerae]